MSGAADVEELPVAVHYGGRRQPQGNNKMDYVGGKTEVILITSTMSFTEFSTLVGFRLQISMKDKLMVYSAKADFTVFASLRDSLSLKIMLRVNSEAQMMYVYVEDAVTPLVSKLKVASAGSFDGLSKGMDISEYIEEEPRLGTVFPKTDMFISCLVRYAARNHFMYDIKHNKEKYKYVTCRVPSCPWSLRCSGSGGVVVVTAFTNVHVHLAGEEVITKVKMPAKEIGKIMQTKVSRDPDYRPMEILRDLEADYAVHVPYLRAYRGKEAARELNEGLPKHSYRQVPWICNRIMESMPGSRAVYTAHEERFCQLFVAYGPSIRGFLSGCRPLLVIDACHLSGHYEGSLLSATAHDANDNLWPVAYGIVSAENDVDWLWFMTNLKVVLGDTRVVIVSDRNISLLAAVSQVFGAECNAWCLRHLLENLSSFVGSQLRFKKAMKDTAKKLVDKVAYARTEPHFNAALNSVYAFNTRIGEWVEANGPRHWSNALFPLMRWDIMYNNSAESFNAWILQLRHGSVSNFMIGHYKQLVSKLLRVKEETKDWKNGVGPRTELKIAENVFWDLETKYPCEAVVEGSSYNVGRLGRSFAVDLDARTCSCMRWMQTGIPCIHVCRVVRHCEKDIYHYVSSVFSNTTQDVIYSESLSPLATNDMPAPETFVGGLRPPQTKRKPGRPKRKRIESQFYHKRPVTCGRCKLTGHNRASCRNPLADN